MDGLSRYEIDGIISDAVNRARGDIERELGYRIDDLRRELEEVRGSLREHQATNHERPY
jgi:hypothetical protein